MEQGESDMVLLARAELSDPYWLLHAAAALGETMSWPAQYLRAAPDHTPLRPAVKQPFGSQKCPSAL